MIMDCEGGGTTGSHQQQQQQGMEEMRKEKQQVEVVAVEEEHKCNESLPPGFRFHPTDEELVSYYLTNKILDSTFSGRAIAEADLNKCEPWDLPDKAKMGEKEWYFFSQRDRKYPTGLRTNRATEAGYWKTTGKDREVYNSQTSALVGMKKTLVFYKGRAPKGEKTNWVMHEYRIEGKYSYNRLPKNCKDEWVVCRIFQKNAGGKKSSVSTGFLDRNSFLELPGSPSLPSLLESPYNTETPCNDQEAAGSVECESSSTKPHPIRQTNQQQLSHYLQTTFPVSESSNQLLPDMDRLLKNSSYMSNLSFMSDNSPSSIFNMHGLLSLANLNMHQKLQPFASQFMFNHNPLLSCSFPPTMNINNFPQDAMTANLNNNNQPTVSPMLRSFSSQSNLMIDPSSSITSASVPPQNLDFPTSNTEDQIVAVGSSTAAADAPVMDFDSIWNFREHPF